MVGTARYDDAVAMLTPIFNNPDGGPGVRQGRDLLELIEWRRAAAGSD